MNLKHPPKPFLTILTLTVTFFLSACSFSSKAQDLAPLKTVAAVDMQRYAGRWYEVAMIPNRFQAMCKADSQATYKAIDKTWTGDTLSVTNRCRKADGSVETAQGYAKLVAGSANAKLRVSFIRPIYGDYWVVGLGQGANYDWAMVAEPSREYGWVLSRTPQLDAASFEQALQAAERNGYKRSQFVKTPQTQSID